ncbi:MAG: zinc ribbon domain-containing protein, partial [Bacteroidota bacterium]
MNAFRCPKCGKSTMGWENFCVNCGEPLNVECPVCGEIWRYMFIYDYCPNCGNDMKPDPLDANESLESANEISTNETDEATTEIPHDKPVEP